MILFVHIDQNHTEHLILIAIVQIPLICNVLYFHDQTVTHP